MIPADPRFIACRASLPEARVALFGIPFEGRVNLRRGADHGPRELRLASDSIETYSPFLGRDLEDLAIADLGDCELGDGSPREQLGHHEVPLHAAQCAGEEDLGELRHRAGRGL